MTPADRNGHFLLSSDIHSSGLPRWFSARCPNRPYSRFRYSRYLWRPRPGTYPVRGMSLADGTRRGHRGSVYGGVAIGLAFDSDDQRHHSASVVTIGCNDAQCRAMVTR